MSDDRTPDAAQHGQPAPQGDGGEDTWLDDLIRVSRWEAERMDSDIGRSIIGRLCDELTQARAAIDGIRALLPTRVIAPGERCQFEGCDQPATVVAEGEGYADNDGNYTLTRDPYDEPDEPHPSPLRHPGLGVYCMDHGREVAGENGSCYTPECPNCRCRFGVG